MRTCWTKPFVRRKNLGMVLIETPANPTIVMTDIQRACQTVAG